MKNRIIISATAVTLVFCLCSVRLCVLATGSVSQKAANISTGYTLEIDSPRGTVFDRNMKPVTNRGIQYRAVLLPAPQTVTAIYEYFDKPTADAIAGRLKSGNPVVTDVPDDFVCPSGGVLFRCRDKKPEYQPCSQLAGYLDNKGISGICGLQKTFDELLKCRQKTSVYYPSTAAGDILLGVEPKITLNEKQYSSGVLTTLDIDIQLACDSALNGISKGAAVVMKAGSGDILAMSSAPDFDLTDIEKATENTNSPLLNRALLAYDLGSVFKLAVAVTALENGYPVSRSYTCSGSIALGQTFGCHEETGHGVMDMRSALAASCNPYFIDLASAVGGKALYDTAIKLGFAKSFSLCGDIQSAAGTLPKCETVGNIPAELGNFAIGQGNVTVTPLQIAAMINAIASDGVYYTPQLITGTTDSAGNKTLSGSTGAEQVMSAQTANELRELMKQVISSGTGTNAAPDNGIAGGKTATAETGWKNADGSYGNNAWFAGFYEIGNEKYSIAVLVEGGVSGSISAAPVFKKICDGIYNAQIINTK